MPCPHDGPHSAAARYDRESGSLHFTLVCDGCGNSRRDLGTLRHSIDAKPYANSLAERIGRELGLSEEAAGRLRLAALARDIGKHRIAEAILSKPGPLTAQEWIEVRRHPQLGALLLAGPGFDDIRQWVVHHHERWDGTGYPDGLRGGAIPLESRALAVVDAYEAMTEPRPYRSPLGHVAARREIWANAGTPFDPVVVAAFGRAIVAAGPAPPAWSQIGLA
jgi:HD-GYP domain-containing protein (c-di-GMP phosphodiesterase class II)